MNSLRYFDFGTARPVLLLIARIAVVLIFIIFGFPKMMGFDGTVQYMASLGAPMPMLAAIIGHHYWDMTGDAVGPNMINFWKNVSIAGAFLLLAITGPGAISLDRR